MNRAEFTEEKRKLWAKWERHYGMKFVPDFRESVETKLRIVYSMGQEALKDLDTFLPDYVEPGLILLNNKNGGTKEVAPKKRRREFEQRFYLVRFVIDCWERDGRSYIPWKYVTAEWNKALFSDQISKAVLKAEYYRALREREVIIQLLAVKTWMLEETARRFLESLRSHFDFDPDALKTFIDAWSQLAERKNDRPMRDLLKPKGGTK